MQSAPAQHAPLCLLDAMLQQHRSYYGVALAALHQRARQLRRFRCRLYKIGFGLVQRIADATDIFYLM
jgi:hypothetical protein